MTARDDVKVPPPGVLGIRQVRCTLYGADRSTVIARLDLAPPIPAKVEHGGQFFKRAHRLPSGWAFEQVR